MAFANRALKNCQTQYCGRINKKFKTPLSKNWGKVQHWLLNWWNLANRRPSYKPCVSLSFEMITPGSSGFINIWLTLAQNIGEVLNSEKSMNRSTRGNVVQFYIKMVTRYTPKKLRECLIASQWVLLKVIQRKCNSECPGCATDVKLMALQENNLYCLGTSRIWDCVWSGRKV